MRKPYWTILSLLLITASVRSALSSSCGPAGPFAPATTSGMAIIGGVTNPILNPQTHANMNGVLDALTFPGTDIGAQVNAAMASSPGGTIIQIPAGIYTTPTTIQCPVAATGSGQATFIIQGSGMQSAVGGASQTIPLGTIIKYTGAGDLFNQVEPGFMSINATGCKLRDMTLNGASAGPAAIGYHFAGTDDAEVTNVKFENFGGAAIKIENPAQMWTERYLIQGTTALEYNGVGIWFQNDTGAQGSFDHGSIRAWLNVGATQVGMLITNGADAHGSTYELNGNIEANATNAGQLLKLDNTVFNATLIDNTECQTPNGGLSCTRINISTASSTFFGNSIIGCNGCGPVINVAGPGKYLPIMQQGLSLISSPNINMEHIGGIAHANQLGAYPTVSACGTGATIDGDSTDTNGVFTFGTGATNACTLHFGNVFARTVSCTAMSDGQPIWFYTNANSGTSITFAGGNCPSNNCQNIAVQYHCIGLGGS